MPKDEEQRSLVLSHDSAAAQDNMLTYSNTHTKDGGALIRGGGVGVGISDSKIKNCEVNLEAAENSYG